MKFGYARVSTKDQNLEAQIDALNKYGVDEIITEKMTGTTKERPALKELFGKIRSGDQVVVYKLDRIGRSTKDLIEIVDTFEKKQVDFVSIQDQIDTSSAMGRFFFRTIASIAELERDIILERTKAGLEAARARGRKGGRPPKDKKAVERALRLYDSKEYTIREIRDMTGVAPTTLHRYLNRRKEQNK